MSDTHGNRLICPACESGWHHFCKEDWIEPGSPPLYVGTVFHCECVEGRCVNNHLKHQAKDAAEDVSPYVYRRMV